MIFLQATIGSGTMMDFGFDVKSFDSATRALIAQSQVIATMLAGTFGLIALSWNYITNALSNIKDNGVKFFDMEEVIRIIVVVSLISCYMPVASALAVSIDSLNAITGLSPSGQDAYGKLVASQMKKNAVAATPQGQISNAIQTTLNDPNIASDRKANIKDAVGDYVMADAGNVDAGTGEKAPVTEKSESSWWNIADVVRNAEANFILGTANAVGVIIRSLIATVTIWAFKILLIIGPFALAFSLLPMWKSQISVWFNVLISTGLVFSTINIIDSVVMASYKTLNAATDIATVPVALLDALSIIIIYTLVFWFTSKWVGGGKGDGGKPIGKAAGMAAAAMAFVGTGGASTAATSVTNVAAGVASDSITGKK